MADQGFLQVPVTEQDHQLGSASAPITLVQYGDYECPDTLESNAAVNAVLERYGDGLRFVYRHYPLNEIHPNAHAAAEAAESAAAQGKFWEMHNALFAHQIALGHDNLIKYAAEAGLDSGQIALDLAAHTYAAHVDADTESGDASDVQGTPTFYINGLRYDGAWETDELLAAIAAAQ